MNEVDGQNDSMDQSKVRAPKRNIEGGTNKIQRFVLVFVDVPSPMMRVSLPYRALPNHLKKLLMLWRFKLH